MPSSSENKLQQNILFGTLRSLGLDEKLMLTNCTVGGRARGQGPQAPVSSALPTWAPVWQARPLQASDWALGDVSRGSPPPMLGRVPALFLDVPLETDRCGTGPSSPPWPPRVTQVPCEHMSPMVQRVIPAPPGVTHRDRSWAPTAARPSSARRCF